MYMLSRSAPVTAPVFFIFIVFFGARPTAMIACVPAASLVPRPSSDVLAASLLWAGSFVVINRVLVLTAHPP